MSREVAMKEEWDRASPYFRHYVACPPSYAAVAAYTEATRRGLPPPLFYDAPRHARAAKGALAELGRATLADGDLYRGGRDVWLVCCGRRGGTASFGCAVAKDAQTGAGGGFREDRSSRVALHRQTPKDGVVRSGGRGVVRSGGRSPPQWRTRGWQRAESFVVAGKWWRAVGLHVSRGTEGG